VGGEDLVGSCRRAQAGRLYDGHAVPVITGRCAMADRHAHPQRRGFHRRPAAVRVGALLHRHRGVECIAGGGEHGHHPVAERLDDDTVDIDHRSLDLGQQTGEPGVCSSVAQAAADFGRRDDVAEHDRPRGAHRGHAGRGYQWPEIARRMRRRPCARQSSMASALPQIKKIVWLTLENRSLDHMLGWLYNNEKLPPSRVFPPKSCPFFDGITPEIANYIGSTRYAPAEGTQDRFQPMRQPRWNPNEWWEDVTQEMYWNAYEQYPNPPWTDSAPMTGFACDYGKWYDTVDEVMGAYTAQQLPVLYGLAESYAVSDRWFSSVPTETNPNRAFSVCGTSLGAVDNKDIEYYAALTLFNVLTNSKSGKSWGIYYQYNGFWDMDPRWFGECFTVDIFP